MREKWQVIDYCNLGTVVTKKFVNMFGRPLRICTRREELET